MKEFIVGLLCINYDLIFAIQNFLLSLNLLDMLLDIKKWNICLVRLFSQFHSLSIRSKFESLLKLWPP
jgi:hypothetical protein